MTSAEKLARLTAPSPARRHRGMRLGDGPVCPVEPKHGPTYLSRDRRTFWCPDQSHDMTSPNRWPNTPEA